MIDINPGLVQDYYLNLCSMLEVGKRYRFSNYEYLMPTIRGLEFNIITIQEDRVHVMIFHKDGSIYPYINNGTESITWPGDSPTHPDWKLWVDESYVSPLVNKCYGSKLTFNFL